MLKCFGVYEEKDFPNVAGEETSASYEETIAPLMDVLLKFRDQVKQNANEGGKTLF